MTPEEIQAAEAAKVAAEKAAAEKAAAEKAEADKVAAAKAAEEEKNKPKPSDAEAKLLKELMEKKEEAKQAKEALAAVNAKLKDIEGLDIAEIKKLMTEKKKAEEEELVRKGEWEKIKAQMKEQHDAAIAAERAVVGERDNTIGDLKTQISELTVGNAFQSSTYITENLAPSASKVRVLYGAHFEYKDGKIIGYDKPLGAKDRAPLVNAAGDPLSFNDALKKIVEADSDKDTILKSKVKAGAESSTTNNGKVTDPNDKKDSVSPKDKIAAGLAAITKKD